MTMAPPGAMAEAPPAASAAAADAPMADAPLAAPPTADVPVAAAPTADAAAPAAAPTADAPVAAAPAADAPAAASAPAADAPSQAAHTADAPMPAAPAGAAGSEAGPAVPSGFGGGVPAGAAGDAAAPKKRAAPGEGRGDGKRRKADFAMGDRGVFFTTMSPGAAGNARRDLVKLLEEAMGVAAGGAAAAPSAASASAQLDAELQELRDTKPTFSMVSHEIAKGTGFLKFAGTADTPPPSELVAKLLERQRVEYQATRMAPCSRLLCRVLPIDYTCKPYLEHFKLLAQTVLPGHVGPDAEPTVWALEFRARNTSTLKKDTVLAVIDEIVPKGRHKAARADEGRGRRRTARLAMGAYSQDAG
ncbi:unnamed protein product [Prorocentrum cordatum]|uniref:THUMP domain-containing protein n=1 Tax=Prorocentrum cordatum TaxID=2364126 RepID=A0ABN9UQG3_9DINO|nr:unnamed protein product [Polarella glacialis]